MIRVDENLSSVSIQLDVNEKSIHQLITLAHGYILLIMDDLSNWSLSMNKDRFSRSSYLAIRNRILLFNTQVSNALVAKIKQWHSLILLSLSFNTTLGEMMIRLPSPLTKEACKIIVLRIGRNFSYIKQILRMVSCSLAVRT
jgi:hypothetical protein